MLHLSVLLSADSNRFFEILSFMSAFCPFLSEPWVYGELAVQGLAVTVLMMYTAESLHIPVLLITDELLMFLANLLVDF